MNTSPSRYPAALSHLDDETFSWSQVVGGWRGACEALLPGLLFVNVYLVTHDLLRPLIAAGGAALILCVLRLIQRQPLTQALSGLLGVGISVAWALWSGRSENYCAWGIIPAAAWCAALMLTVLAGRPALAWALGWVQQFPAGWMRDEAYAPLVRRCRTVTLLWAAMFAVRFLVQLPLWWGGYVVALGVAKLALGLPLFLPVCWLTWVGLRPFVMRSSTPSE